MKVGEGCRETVVRVYRGGVFVFAYVMRTYSTKYMSVFVSWKPHLFIMNNKDMKRFKSHGLLLLLFLLP